jgi:hypothetical protein
MPCRDVVRADETLEAGPQGRSLHVDAAEGVRPVEHDHISLEFGRRFEAIEHRRLKCVITAADILEVDNDCVHAAKLIGSRAQGLDVRSIEAVYAERAGSGIPDADQILRDAVEAVLRAEECYEFDTGRSQEEIGSMLEL